MAIRFDEIQLTGSGSHRWYPELSNGATQLVQIQTSHGYLRLGADNTSYAHILTDRANFYFNNNIVSDGNISAYSGTENITGFNEVHAGSFVDKDNTSYYSNPAGTSVLNDIEIDDYIVHKGDNDTYILFESNSIKLAAGGTARLSVTGDVNVNSTTDLNINGTNRRINFTAGSGTIRTTTANDLIFATNSQTAMYFSSARDAYFSESIFGKSINNDKSFLYRFGGLFLTWDSDSYGTNFEHSITSTHNGTYSDAITINSYGHMRINFDSNNNDSGTFSIGHHGTGTSGTLLTLDSDGHLTLNTANAQIIYATGGFIEVNDGATRSMTFVDTGYVHMHHQVCFHHGVVWDETTQGTNQGSIHLDPDSGTDHAGGAITFGASDTSSGTTAQGGIYVRTDGSYGTKMYLSTTDSYASGSKTAMKIDHSGKVYVTRGNLFLGNVDTAAATENTALFLNGSTGEVEKRELGSGAFGSGGGTNFITNNADDITTGEIKFQRNDTQSIIESENTSASNAGQFRLKHSYGNMEMRSLRGAMNIFATNTVNLGYGTAIKLATISGGVQVTGKVQASSSIGNLATGTNGQQMEYGTTAVTTLRFDADRWRLYAGAGSGEVFTVEQNGEVGIKDSSPSYELDVNGDIRATGDVIAFSDERVKENIVTIENALDTVTKLRGVQFNKIGQDKKSVGVIAQEVLKVLPEVVAHDKKDMYSVAYGNMVGVLIEAIKELNAEVKELKEKLNN